MSDSLKITRTNFCIVVKCKCGGIIAATMIFGGVSIDEEFTDTMAEAIVEGGKVEIVNTKETPITLDGCHC